MKQTAVEWLVNEIRKGNFNTASQQIKLVQQAKEMERQQIIDANLNGFNEGCRYLSNEKLQFESVEHYYQETFKSEEHDN